MEEIILSETHNHKAKQPLLHGYKAYQSLCLLGEGLDKI